MDKNSRHQLIREIIVSKQVSSQQDLVTQLSKKGLVVTQATVSRDISELGLIKSKNLSGRSIYVLQGHQTVSAEVKLERAFSEYGLSVEQSDNLVVIKTSPGAAQTVARCMDEANMEEILGTVAGDDTILAIARDKKRGKVLRDFFSKVV